jgi:hypothetical protein
MRALNARVFCLERLGVDSSHQTMHSQETHAASSSRMKQIVDSSASWRPGTSFFSFIALAAIVSLLQTGCKRSPAATGTASIRPQTETAGHAATSTGNRPVARLVCPLLGSSTELSPLPLNGGHRVILSWKASAPEDAKHAAAVGYCIYRGTGQNGPPTELLNHFPFSANKCADDLVENGKKYHYVVRAISDKGLASIASGTARAAIPKEPRTNSKVSADSTPLCRQPAAVK